MKIREEFVQHALSGRFPVTALCNAYGISEKTGHKWLHRFRKEGRSGWRVDFGPLTLGSYHEASDTFIQEVQWKADEPPTIEQEVIDSNCQGSPILPV